MLKFRRGLLAAGIAAAVVGSIGVASTLNAGAEQIPAPAEAPVLTPPAKLPWGDTPEDIDTGRDGASSRSLKSAGLDAAAPDSSGAEAGEAYAPKGITNGRTFRRSEKTTVIPPVPPSATPSAATPSASAPADDKPSVYFHYNVGAQAAVSQGAYANMTISRPALAKEDYHTLAEIAVQSPDGIQVVEVGWNVDRVVNGDDDPHLFVFHWVDGKPTCYNGCGFVQFSANIRPGDTLPQDTVKKFGIQYIDGAWWIAYDTEWVGYYPDKLWATSGFVKSGHVQIFGEVAASSLKPCTQMGNGRTPEDTTAARVSSVTYLNGPTVEMAVRSTSDVYPVSKLSSRTFRYGGPGAC